MKASDIKTFLQFKNNHFSCPVCNHRLKKSVSNMDLSCTGEHHSYKQEYHLDNSTMIRSHETYSSNYLNRILLVRNYHGVMKNSMILIQGSQHWDLPLINIDSNIVEKVLNLLLHPINGDYMKISDIKTIRDFETNSFECPICYQKMVKSDRDLICDLKPLNHKYWQDFYFKVDEITRGVEIYNSYFNNERFVVQNFHATTKNSSVLFQKKEYFGLPLMEIDNTIFERVQNILLLR